MARDGGDDDDDDDRPSDLTTDERECRRWISATTNITLSHTLSLTHTHTGRH